ncbi:putative RNA-binding protein eif1ad [Coemansia sp. RSA 2336]|nr:putative RNA-binding protein eif1ad [Coemansia sp. RSA 2336]
MGRGKYTTQEALDAHPDPTPTCPIVRVLGPRGQHLHEVAVLSDLVTDDINARLNPHAEPWFSTLVELPPKFRSVLWVRRGGFVLADLSEQFSDKIGGQIAMVLMAAQVKQLKQAGRWPAGYSSLDTPGQQCDSTDDEQHSDSLIVHGNPNRRPVGESDTSSDEDSDE